MSARRYEHTFSDGTRCELKIRMGSIEANWSPAPPPADIPWRSIYLRWRDACVADFELRIANPHEDWDKRFYESGVALRDHVMQSAVIKPDMKAKLLRVIGVHLMRELPKSKAGKA